MFSLVRGGPRMLYVECTDRERLEAFLIEHARAARFSPELEGDSAFGEEDMLFFVGHGMGRYEHIILVRAPLEETLITMIREGVTDCISNICPSPGMILVRLMGKMEPVVDQLRKEYDAASITPGFFMGCAVLPSTAVFFTKTPLNRSITVEELHSEGLLIDRDQKELLAELRSRDIEFLNTSLQGQKWTNAEIRIYDIYERYFLHYRRLVCVIRGLELGVIVEEGWGKDQAMVLMSVPVYKVRLYTPHSQGELKRICLGLEFDDQGKRLADIDVLENGKRMSWTDFRKKRKGRQGASNIESRMAFAKEVRRSILQQLPARERETVSRLEEELGEQEDT
ncbi:MAG: hypothetical protein K9L28_06300 [Synergistales bacterium]|nr:hypothetical protein [Synergistales bacterium]